MVEQKDYEPTPSGTGEKRATKDHEVSISANSIKRSYKANHKQHNTDSIKWNKRIAVAAILYTVFTFFILLGSLYSAYESRRAANAARAQAATSADTETRQLRAYIGIIDTLVLQCPLCETAGSNKPINFTRDDFFANTITIEIQNGGLTPAHAVTVKDSWEQVGFGRGLPKNFDYPINPPGVNEFAIPQLNPVASLNPREKTPVASNIDKAAIPLIVEAKKHLITLYYYGEIDYIDVFGFGRRTTYCLEYIPDYKTDPFTPCPEHNTTE